MGHEITLLEMLKAGWYITLILVICSIFSITIILERLHTFRKARLDAVQFTSSVLQLLESGRMAEAVAYCDRFRQPLARVIRGILLASGDRANKERVMTYALRVELRQLETYVPALGTIAGIAPLLGLLGTITGIIRSFRDIVLHGSGGPDVVAAGIAEALITTAVGLLVAIPALVGYNYCMTRIRRLAEEIELYAFQIIEGDVRE